MKSYRRRGEPLPRDVISVRRLVKVRGRAKRRRVWFRVLGKAERGVVDLIINHVEDVRSSKLAGIVAAIVIKLKKALESQVERLVRTTGRSTAQKLAHIAQEWGNKLAHKWSEDRGFARYLAVMHLNESYWAGFG